MENEKDNMSQLSADENDQVYDLEQETSGSEQAD